MRQAKLAWSSRWKSGEGKAVARRPVASVAWTSVTAVAKRYTAIMRSGILSRERFNVAEAETLEIVEGNTLRTEMRGATALPWSETPLRMNGTRRNLGDLNSPNPLWRIWVTTESRGDETVAEEVRSWTAAYYRRCLEQNWWEPAAEMAEGRRPIGGKVSGDACPGAHGPGNGMSTQAANLRISGVHNRDRVRPLIGARCGKAARRDLCGGNGETRFRDRDNRI